MAAEPLRIVPDPSEGVRETLVTMLFVDFLDQLRQASSLVEVNAAAGVAFELLRQIT